MSTEAIRRILIIYFEHKKTIKVTHLPNSESKSIEGDSNSKSLKDQTDSVQIDQTDGSMTVSNKVNENITLSMVDKKYEPTTCIKK